MKVFVFFSLITVLALASCNKDYYTDTGKSDPNFNGTVMEYITQDTLYFDTLARIVKYAGLEQTLSKDEITFFAPPDPCFGKLLSIVNDYQLSVGKDSVTRFEQIKPEVWKYFLSMYLFSGKHLLKDYHQVDTLALDTYKGAMYETINGQTMNIGVIYNDAVNDSIRLKYQGYRQLMLSYIPDESRPLFLWVNAPVAASDIQPLNGVVHRLKYMAHIFSFYSMYYSFGFIQMAVEKGIDYP
jgi:uncharacterized surface protein with fasciclin (FAS1) repeats